MDDSWIVSNLNAALTTWNDKLGEIWQLLTQSPQTFKDGQVWAVMVGIHGALQAIGYGLLVLFFAAGVVKTCGTFVEAKRPEQALKLFIRFALAKAAVTYGLDLMLAIFQIVQGMVSTVINQSGVLGMSAVTLPQELIDAINEVGFWDSIPLWAVTLIGGLLITVLSFVMILTVYGRMFSLWMYAAIAPVPLSSFAGEPTSNVGKNFLRSYAGVCLQGCDLGCRRAEDDRFGRRLTWNIVMTPGQVQIVPAIGDDTRENSDVQVVFIPLRDLDGGLGRFGMSGGRSHHWADPGGNSAEQKSRSQQSWCFSHGEFPPFFV